MNKKIKKIISLSSAFTFVLGVLLNPGLVTKASVRENNHNVTTEMQYKLNTLNETFKNDSNFNVRINNENIVEIYNNEVAKINESEAKEGRAMVYGPWFGGADSYYSMSPSETIKLVAVLTAAFTPFLNSTSIAVQAATSISGLIGSTITVNKGQYVEVDRTKRYREVKYSDGTFAYWQTKIGASVTRANTYLGADETIISGGMW